MPQISLTNLDKFAQFVTNRKSSDFDAGYGTTFGFDILIVPRNPNAKNDETGLNAEAATTVDTFATSNEYAVIPKGYYILNQNSQKVQNIYSGGFKITGIPFSVFGSNTVYNGFEYKYDSAKNSYIIYYIQSDGTEDEICFANNGTWAFNDAEYGPPKIGICIKKDVYINVDENLSDWNNYWARALNIIENDEYIFKKYEMPQVGSILEMSLYGTKYPFLVLESNYPSVSMRVIPVDSIAETVADGTLNSGRTDINSLSTLPTWVPEILKNFRIFGANIEGVSILDMQNCIERMWDNGESYNLALQYQTSNGDTFGPVEPGAEGDIYTKHKSLVVPLMLEDVIRFFKLVTSESGIQNSTNGSLNIIDLWRYMLPGYSSSNGICFTWNQAYINSSVVMFQQGNGNSVPVYAISPALFEWAVNNQSDTGFSYTITKSNIPGVNA